MRGAPCCHRLSLSWQRACLHSPQLGWAPHLSEDLGTRAGFEGDSPARQGLGLVTVFHPNGQPKKCTADFCGGLDFF